MWSFAPPGLSFRDMAKQLRVYTVKPGEMDAFCQEWGEQILPLRLQRGFRVIGPWVIDETNQFVWILEHDGDFEVADSRYYDSPERKKVDPDPVRHLEKNEHWMLRDP
jgi:NIPSNAP